MRWVVGARSRALVAVLAVGGIAAVGGCSAKSTDTATSAPASSSGGNVSTNGLQIGGGTPASTAPLNGQPSSVQVLDQPPEQTGRKIISTATMTVKVEDVVAAKDKANAKVLNDLHGQVFSEQTSVSNKSTSTVTYKVGPDDFDRALRELSLLGKLASEEIKTDDVTKQVVDLDARIQAAEASLGRVRDLVGRTNNVTELANMENEVQRRQADLESLRGQKKTLEDRADQATIVLTLTTDDAPPPPAPVEAKALPGFFDGLSGGWNVFLDVMTVLGAVVGALLPFSWIMVLGLVIVWLTKRRIRVTRHADA